MQHTGSWGQAFIVFLLATVSVAPSSGTDVDLQPSTKWVHCLEDGRMNVRWSVHSSGKLHSGLQLPEYAERCKPGKPTACKWLASCDATRDCSKLFPGEMSGRKKCLVVINPSATEARSASIQLDLEPAGNWPAIIFGVVVTSLGLLAVVAAGCYSDLKKLAAGDHKKRKRAASNSRQASKQPGAEWQLHTPAGIATSSLNEANGLAGFGSYVTAR